MAAHRHVAHERAHEHTPASPPLLRPRTRQERENTQAAGHRFTHAVRPQETYRSTGRNILLWKPLFSKRRRVALEHNPGPFSLRGHAACVRSAHALTHGLRGCKGTRPCGTAGGRFKCVSRTWCIMQMASSRPLGSALPATPSKMARGSSSSVDSSSAPAAQRRAAVPAPSPRGRGADPGRRRNQDRPLGTGRRQAQARVARHAVGRTRVFDDHFHRHLRAAAAFVARFEHLPRLCICACVTAAATAARAAAACVHGARRPPPLTVLRNAGDMVDAMASTLTKLRVAWTWSTRTRS